MPHLGVWSQLAPMIDIDTDLANILTALGSSLTAHSVKAALVDTDKEMRADSKAHGGSGDEPFWDMLSDERTHLFSVFGTDTFELYVFSSPDFTSLISKLNSLAMADVDELRELLATSYRIEAPQVSVGRSDAEYWLGR